MWFKLNPAQESNHPVELFSLMMARSLPGEEDIDRDNVYVMHPEGPIVNLTERKAVTANVLVTVSHGPLLLKLDVIKTPKGMFIADEQFEEQLAMKFRLLEKNASERYSHITVDVLQMMCRHGEISPFELKFSSVEINAMSIPEPLKKVWVEYVEAKQKFEDFTSTW